MKNIVLILMVSVSFNLIGQDISGKWKGIIKIKENPINIVITILKKNNSYISMIGVSNNTMPSWSITFTNYKDSLLNLDDGVIKFYYDGKLNTKGQFVGKLKYGENFIPLTLSLDKIENTGNFDNYDDNSIVLGSMGEYFSSTNRNLQKFRNEIKFELGWHRLIKISPIKIDSGEFGTVSVRITVNRQGNVIKAEPGARGSTTVEPEKLLRAKTAALSAKFTKNLIGPEEEVGLIIFDFNGQ